MSQKVGSLKDFKVCDVPEKEPLHNEQKKLATRSARSFARRKKEKFWHKYPIVLSTAVPIDIC
jgi:hypothetical protein